MPSPLSGSSSTSAHGARSPPRCLTLLPPASICGLDVVWRHPPPDTRHLVGRIARINGDVVELAETMGTAETVPVADVVLEPSSAAFKRCLRVLLGDKYESFENARRAQQDRLLN